MIPMILLYIGTMLIAFEIVGQVSHVPTFVILPLYHSFVLLISSGDKRIHLKPRIVRIMLRILLRIILLPIFIVVMLLVLLVIILWLIGWILKLLNNLINNIYQKGLTPEHPRLMEWIRPFLPQRTDEEILTALKQIRIPFMACIGIILLTLGFILHLIGPS
ncbi:hypothetical protein ES703_22272 [subsurface metagenome]